MRDYQMRPYSPALLTAIALLAGGSCRMAAVHAGRGARLTPLEGAGYARVRALNLVALPVLPAVVIGLLALLVLVFVLLLRVPVLNVLSGALFVIPIAVGLLGAILAITVVASFPLMPAAIAVEDCDAGDAITRAGALVLARPLAWIGILLASLAALAVACREAQVPLAALKGVTDLVDHHEPTHEAFLRNLKTTSDRVAAAAGEFIAMLSS